MTPQATTTAPLIGLNLPPTFVTDHCLRTLFYRGAMSPVDLALQWRVSQDVAIEIVESVKNAGLIGADAGQQTFERHARVHLTAAGQEQLALARQRTWYSGALPVSLRDFAAKARENAPATAAADAVRASLSRLAVTPALADELGQAVSGGDTVAITGAAPDEQRDLTEALGAALEGQISLPYAIYAGGAVIRVFDPRHHQLPHGATSDDDALDILRAPQQEASPWMDVRRPTVTLAGGVLSTDVRPAFDEDARFYLAPPPLAAWGGLLAVFDANTQPAELAELARLWLAPGRHGDGVLLLRSGERIEVPWRATTLLFGSDVQMISKAAGVPAYHIDLAPVSGHQALRDILIRRLAALTPASDLVDQLAAGLEAAGTNTRIGAATAARYLIDRAAYEAASHTGPLAIADTITFVTRRLGDTAADPQRPANLRLAS